MSLCGIKGNMPVDYFLNSTQWNCEGQILDLLAFVAEQNKKLEQYSICLLVILLCGHVGKHMAKCKGMGTVSVVICLKQA
jgi:hypothetical protein